jgi:disulfide bond formation protein DsbB
MLTTATSTHWLQTKTPWVSLILLSILMLGVALFYQYQLDELPCVVCIHFRLLFVLVILFAVLGLFTRKSKFGNIISSLGIVSSFAFMTERAYVLLGTERRFIHGECSFGLNFPDWIAVDKWLPWIFEPKTSCGYTPTIFFGITMAETLMVFSIVMSLATLWMFVSSLRR